jgi:CDP-glucose 4,6-dehydratase
MQAPNKKFWKNKRVLITGNTGFKGSWLSIWLDLLGAEISGISLPAITKPNLFTEAKISNLMHTDFIDIRDNSKILSAIESFQPEIVFHLAAQALVRESYRDPLYTFSTNIIGTANILDTFRKVSSIKTFVIITTDKVYENLEKGVPFLEGDRLGGIDPYSSSKAASEIVINSYRSSYASDKDNISIASARAGNVIGGGDWSQDRLIPDAMKAWNLDQEILIRSPSSTRPWQHVIEPLFGYLILAEKLYDCKELEGAYNFGPNPDEVALVKDVITKAHKFFGKGSIAWRDERDGPYESKWLSLNVDKAKESIGIKQKWKLDASIEKTINWYREYYSGSDARELCQRDIESI